MEQDEATVKAIAEQTFAEKVVANFPQIKESSLKFEPGNGQLGDLIKEDQTDYGALKSNLVSDAD